MSATVIGNASNPVDVPGGLQVNGVTVINSSGKVVESAGIEISDGDTFADSNGNEIMEFTVVSSAVNHVGISNAATGNSPTLGATGGDTDIDLTLSPKGDGAVVIAGAEIHSEITATSGAGAVAVTGRVHEITTTGTGDALTLANGTAGQRLTLLYVAEGAGGDTAVLTPTSLVGGTTITFNALGDTAEIVYGTNGWYVVGLGGSAAVA